MSGQISSSNAREIGALSAWKKIWVWTSLALSAGYLVWRGLETLNPETPVYSWVFLLAEVLGFLSLVQFVLSTYKLLHREAPAMTSQPTVDVLIPTYNEEPALLLTTIRNCLKLDYPHETYVLDDGNRPEIRELALELGARYIARGDNAGAKAGNLNHALALTSGEFVAIIDADGVPRHDFLTRLLGYFGDEQIALVQVPQTFYNLDSFQHANNTGSSEIWHEQALFFDVIQLGRDYHGSAMCCGSGSLIRRSALEQVGNMPTGTLTEDMHLTLKLQNAGFKSVYHNEPLAFALAPATLSEFVVQRARWATGCFQVFIKEIATILGPSRLTLAQRLFSIPFYYMTAVQRAIYVAASVLYLLAGVSPVAGADWLPYLMAANVVLPIGAYYILARGRARTVMSEMFFLYMLVPYLKAAFVALLPFVRLRFHVTSKKVQDDRPDFGLLLPVAAIFVASGYAVAWALIDMSFDGVNSGRVWSIVCGVFYVMISALALGRARKTAAWHEAYSFFDPRPVRIIRLGATPSEEGDFGVATAISERHIKFYRTQALEKGEQVAIEISLPQNTLTFEAEVDSCTQDGPQGLHQISLRYPELASSVRSELLKYFFEDATPRMISGYTRPLASQSPAVQGSERRSIERTEGLVPVLIRSDEKDSQDQLALSADVSEGGSRVQIDSGLAMGSVVHVRFPWSQRSVRARIVRRGGGEGGRQGGRSQELGLQFESPVSGLPTRARAAGKLKAELPA
jgi:cellulose synthase (UDP-forming)